MPFGLIDVRLLELLDCWTYLDFKYIMENGVIMVSLR